MVQFKNTSGTVFVVDDDQAVRDSLERLSDSVGLSVGTFEHAQAFLDWYSPTTTGCLILDIRMPGMDGLALQQKFVDEGIRIPIIIMSAHGDIEKAVQAMRNGALDFIKKPYKATLLLERIQQALELDHRIRRAEEERANVARRLALLTPREREVMERLVAGRTPKQIALEFGLSRKTVDVHRGHILTKLQVDSVVELAGMIHHTNGAPQSASSLATGQDTEQDTRAVQLPASI